VVSVCVPPAAHADVVVECARAPSVRAVHCEKPMAVTWRDCVRTVAVCDTEGVQPTFNHQRRFSRAVAGLRELLDGGAVGRPVRVELGSSNLFDYGTHLFDLCGYLTDDDPAEWVHASVDHDGETRQYGVSQETWGLQWQDRNGVTGVASTGTDPLVDCQLRLVGSEGVLEFGRPGGPPLRLRRHGADEWTVVDTSPDAVNGPVKGWGLVTDLARRTGVLKPEMPTPRWLPSTLVERAIESVVSSLESGRSSPLAGATVLRSTELIFACWESARRGQRILFPLDIEDNPLEAMITARRFEAPDDE
jgi:predicted dehydrogenase